MPQNLIDGLRRFRSECFPSFRDHYRRLAAQGQHPSTLFIGCSDSRVVPTLLTDAPPGELFVVRNVGNLVPPFESELDYFETPAAIEFATFGLQVEHIVVCGHSHCGAIRALYAPPDPQTPHLARWLELARGAKLDQSPSEEVLRRTERRSVELQVERLMSYPSVREAVEGGRLSLHGWHYVIEDGEVHVFDLAGGRFVAASSIRLQDSAQAASPKP